MIDFSTPSIYERVINETDTQQIRLVINTFRGVEYLSLRKYYLDFDKWFLKNHNFECLSTKNLLIFRVSTKVNNPKNNTINNILKK